MSSLWNHITILNTTQFKKIDEDKLQCPDCIGLKGELTCSVCGHTIADFVTNELTKQATRRAIVRNLCQYAMLRSIQVLAADL